VSYRSGGNQVLGEEAGMAGFIPVYISFRGLNVAVVGGGSVGFRRARLLSDAGAHVTVYSIEFSEDVKRLAEEGKVRLVRVPEGITPAGLADMIPADTTLVIISTNDLRFNKQLSSKLLERGILVNNATDAKTGNTVFPFKGEVYNGGIKIAVTSLGKTGVAARRALEYCLDRLENNEYLHNLYLAMSVFKEILGRCIDNPKERLPLYFKVDEDEAFQNLVKSGLLDKALDRALKIAGLPKDCARYPTS
jgi:precorrin-2 dehydrogenase/sirohydrochlorin ferrochelatase